MDLYENTQKLTSTLSQQDVMMDENDFPLETEEMDRGVVLVETRSMGYPASWVIVENSDEASG